MDWILAVREEREDTQVSREASVTVEGKHSGDVALAAVVLMWPICNRALRMLPISSEQLVNISSLTSLTLLGMQSSRLSSLSFITLVLQSSMCSDTGTEYCMGDRAWLLGLSDSSVHGVTTEAGSSLTGMGVARGAGMHCALDRSAEGEGNRCERQDLAGT